MMVPWRYVLAVHIEKMRPYIRSWKQFAKDFDLDVKTVRDIRYEFGILVSVGPNAKPSPDFHGPGDYFLGEGI